MTDSRTSEIRVYDVAARLRRIFRVQESGRPVTREMIEASLELEPVGPGEYDFRSDYAEMPIPDSLPVFRSLQVDEVGWLWVEVYQVNPAASQEWMVFDPNGRAHGTVETPAGLEVRSIGRDYIWGVWRDELGVEYVRRYALHRSVMP